MQQYLDRQIITIVPLVGLLYKLCGQRIIKGVHDLVAPPKRTAEKLERCVRDLHGQSTIYSVCLYNAHSCIQFRIRSHIRGLRCTGFIGQLV